MTTIWLTVLVCIEDLQLAFICARSISSKLRSLYKYILDESPVQAHI